MDPARFRLKAFGLCLVAALGLMAFMAAGAQATWKVLGTAISANTGIEFLNHTSLKFSVPAKELEIECALLHSDGGILIPAELALAELLFSECKTFASHSESPGCKPKEPIVAKALGRLILHGTPAKNYLLLEPDPAGGNTRFARVEFIAGCLFPATNLTGNLVLECLTESLGADDCANERLSHLLREAPAGLFTDQLLYGASPLTLSGVMKAKLTGSDCTWSGSV